MLPVGHWWTLRKKFKQSIPGVVTDNYLATALDMSVGSTRANVLPFLKPLGIIDDEGRTTGRAKLWRDDGHYPEVCKAIAAEVYPKSYWMRFRIRGTVVMLLSDGLQITLALAIQLVVAWPRFTRC